ncbi:FadR/GntR family transcriptional regulator [Kaistia dalseonensis]|uniref:DNA-binding FadR family transcriptional regulator n=1 Tax=Kaistia dalseonensis TaxID=410840 RepID=A0ABU0H729_9HYPH|nr:FadR/GntR family transcriptional regulator [Kaistia dalseonensis]MCX5495515.1 FadR/GntR family transcriptional regulator [Kaistia dalseonensis]MDQ0438107.1 DNA-binding FadR family transcriptional regulator [Kaistia dalseonensis]
MSEPGSLLRSLSGRPAARNFHTFVINEIGVAIVSGKFAVGTILPSDAEMMASYGVSRTVLREALRTLEAKGMVEARPKVGTRVSQRSRWNLFDQQVLAWHFEAELEAEFLVGLFDIRAALETRAADLAARRRTAEQIRLLKYWVHQMELVNGDVESHALAVLEVHRVIAEASGNPLLRSAIGLVELTLALVAVAGSEAERAAARVALTTLSRELIEMIEAGDAPGAVAAMRAIIEFGGRRALEGRRPGAARGTR